jgi:hypothetical protein
MKIRIIDSQKNIDRYMDKLKNTETDLDIMKMRTEDIEFLPIEFGYAKCEVVSVGLCLVNAREMGRLDPVTRKRWQGAIFVHSSMVLDIQEDLFFRSFTQGMIHGRH